MDYCEPQPGNSDLNSSWWSHFWSGDFMPHGMCYLWRPEIVWTHVISDLLIGLAYYSIPIILFMFLRKRRDVPFNAIFVIFGIFILSCGTTHLLEIVNVWWPIYGISAVVKVITALVSVLAVFMLIPVIPQALALPSIKSANEQLQKTTNELRRSNAELEQFAFVASHDLQEPLRMVSMHLDLLQRIYKDQPNPKADQYRQVAIDGAERMRALIAALLEFSRIDHVQAPTVLVDANVAMAEALENLKAAIQASGAEVTHGNLPKVLIDRTQLVQVFQNLIGNAMKFRRADRPTVHVSAVLEGSEWIFSVKDNGIGIEPQHFERIFVVFQRLHDRKTHEGTGIGLSSVKKIVERNNGRIWVTSQLGVGSVFRFTLPD